MIPVWVQILFAAAAMLTAIRLIVSMRKRSWSTPLGSVRREASPALFWAVMIVGSLLFLMFLVLAAGSIIYPFRT
jgi:lipid-A-disaccharide synthase-like uncharacterized protein